MLAHSVNTPLDASIDVLCHLLERDPVLDPLDGACDAGLGSLGETLSGGGEMRDASLPTRSPLDSL